VIWICWYLFVGAMIGASIMATFPEEDRGPYFFVIPALMPLVWGPLLLLFYLGQLLG
jgi:hypothetical protein